MRNLLLLLSLIVTCKYSSGQNYLLPNERVIFAFETGNKKKIVLARDSSDGYIIYRFGIKSKIELEYPETKKDSWKKFTYSFYLRGGGIENEGLDLNYLYFIHDKFKYVIYNTYSAKGEQSKCGIKIINTQTNKTVDIPGITKTIEGSLIEFRENNLLEKSDEIFE